MQDQNPTYPLKVVSRALPATRTNKLRLSWFVLGVAFGVGCTWTLTAGMQPHMQVASIPSTNDITVVPAVVDMPLAPVVTAELQPPVPVAATEAPLIPIIEAPAEQAAKEVTLITANAETASAPEISTHLTSPAPSVAQQAYPLTLNVKVENGDTLINMLTDNGATYDDAHNAVRAIGKQYDVKKLDIGQEISISLDRSGDKPHITGLVLPTSQTSSVELTRSEKDDFKVKKVEAPVERKVARASGAITSSLYETGIEKGLSPSLLSEIISAYSYDVDFQRDIKQGDAIDVMYERLETSEGQIAGYGNILYAQLALGDRTLKIYRHVGKDGNADYYNAKGESVRKALLRTPINGAKITSGFGMRNHPILGYSKMHRGVDFGAPTGTPIYAAGDGAVDFVGVKGGYGNYLRIKHNGTYSSAYAHISRFAKGIAPGSKVRQGQIVAYVGSTGNSTGPHLHYEILANNAQVNPANVKFKTGNTLSGKELVAFRKNIENIEASLGTSPDSNKVAMTDAPRKKTAN